MNDLLADLKETYKFRGMFVTADSLEAAKDWAEQMDIANGNGPICQTSLYMIVNYVIDKLEKEAVTKQE
jgi:hypothetical protein